MSFFHKKKCHNHYAIWTSDSNFLLAQKKYFRASLRLALISGTGTNDCVFRLEGF